MPAAYPSSIVTFSAITDGTIITADLFTETADEIDAMQTELGLEPMGSAGSISERLDNCMDAAGNLYGNVKSIRGGDSNRSRVRAGITHFNTDDLSANANWARGTVTFDVAMQNACQAAVLQIQNIESDKTDAGIPTLACFINGSGSTTDFDFAVSSGDTTPSGGGPPDAGTEFLLHWCAWESPNTQTGF